MILLCCPLYCTRACRSTGHHEVGGEESEYFPFSVVIWLASVVGTLVQNETAISNRSLWGQAEHLADHPNDSLPVVMQCFCDLSTTPNLVSKNERIGIAIRQSTPKQAVRSHSVACRPLSFTQQHGEEEKAVAFLTVRV